MATSKFEFAQTLFALEEATASVVEGIVSDCSVSLDEFEWSLSPFVTRIQNKDI